MAHGEDSQQILRDQINKILSSPAEIENGLSRIDGFICANPALGLYAVNLFTETAAQAGLSAIGPRLLEAENAIQEGKALTAEPPWMRYRDMGSIKPPPSAKRLPSLNKSR